VEASTSAIFSDLYLQHLEHNEIHNILIKYNILGYFMYVDDILILYENTHTDIDHMLSNLQFTTEK
jgi:hypothetical protein